MVYSLKLPRLFKTRQGYNLFHDPVEQFLGFFHRLKGHLKANFSINEQEEERDKKLRHYFCV